MKQKLFDWIYRSLRKLGIRESYALSAKDCMAHIKEIADRSNEDYYSVFFEVNSMNGTKMHAYINGIGMTKSYINFDQVIEDLSQDKKLTKVSPIEDIIF